MEWLGFTSTTNSTVLVGYLFSSFGSISLFPVTFGAWPSLFRDLYLISPDRANLCLLCKCVFGGKDFVRGGGGCGTCSSV